MAGSSYMQLARVKKFKKMVDGYANLMDYSEWFRWFHIIHKFCKRKHHERCDKYKKMIGSLDHEDIELTVSKKTKTNLKT